MFEIRISANKITETNPGTDITPYIAFGGVKWQRSDVDGSNAGRALGSGKMIRDRLSTKYRLDITCRPLTGDEAQIVLQAIHPEYVYVKYFDPEWGWRTNVRMYSNNIPATFLFHSPSGGEYGTDWWTGIEFPLIEQ